MDPSLGMCTTQGALALVGAGPASLATIVGKVSTITDVMVRVLRRNLAP